MYGRPSVVRGRAMITPTKYNEGFVKPPQPGYPKKKSKKLLDFSVNPLAKVKFWCYNTREGKICIWKERGAPLSFLSA